MAKKSNVKCPTGCGTVLRPVDAQNARSRYLPLYICSSCGVREALDGFFWKEQAKPLPPDPEGQNADRADWAREALVRFMGRTGTDACDAVGDLLCDLMHFCDRFEGDGPDGGYQAFDDALERARDHYRAETYDDGPLGNLPEGVQAVSLDDPAKVHETIAKAVGENFPPLGSRWMGRR